MRLPEFLIKILFFVFTNGEDASDEMSEFPRTSYRGRRRRHRRRYRHRYY